MNRIRFLGAAALALAAAGAAPALAQNEIVAQANPDADRLADDMRVLAANPRDVAALLDAGMTSARLGDTSAALAFFQRAEAIDPSNPKISAGRAMALVRLERPGEALRLFQAAEAGGVPASQYAADRGFAYDLLGQPGLAQRDYKLAMASGGRDDETLRRYALSLGITGDTAEAMQLLDPLLRRSDRAAWRARAFILAMNGDVPGAEKIASNMMPGNMGQALTPFFRRLGSLAPADRAFAVHFGELSPTQARLADARMAPTLPRYVPAPRPVQLAAAPPVAAKPAPAKGRDRRSRREREADERKAAEAAAAEAARRAQAAADRPVEAPLPAPPQFVRRAEPIVQPIPAPKREEEPVEMARREPAASTPARAIRPAETRAAEPRPATVASAPPQPAAPAPAAAETAASAPPTPTPAPAPVVASSEPAPPGPAKVGQEDSILAAIVNNITIPAEELEAVANPPADGPAVQPAPAPVRVAEATPVAAKPRPAPTKPEPAKPNPRKKVEAAKPDPKAKKPEPKKPDPAKTEPSRIWVQVAGGANEDMLARAWKGVVAKAPAAMKGKSAWWTPLRATNRVLAGPFKTAAEAQSFVNALGKSGVSAFVFTSEAGQKVNKLAVK